MTRHVVRVAALTAEDDQHRVVYDDRRNRVTDPRDRRVRSFRVRWYLSDGGPEQARTRRFPTHALDQVQDLLVELRRLRDEQVPVADDGLTPATATPIVPSSLAATDIGAAIDRFLDVVPLESRNAGSYQTNLNLFRDCLHVQPDGEVRYDPDSEAPLIGWADLTPEVCEDILLIRRHLSIPAWRTHQRRVRRGHHQRRLRRRGTHLLRGTRRDPGDVSDVGGGGLRVRRGREPHRQRRPLPGVRRRPRAVRHQRHRVGDRTTASSTKTTYGYDGRGNRTTVTTPDRSQPTTYGYDGENRLTTVTQPGATGNTGDYTPVAPATVADTRNGTGGVPVAKIGTTTRPSMTFPVTGVAGVPASGNVASVVVNLTAANETAAGFLTAWSGSGPQPGVSNLNFVAGQAISNLAVVPVKSDGTITVSANVATDAIVSIQGWYATASATSTGGTYFSVTPTRVFDSRTGVGTTATRVGAGETRTVTPRVAGVAGVPTSGVAAVTANVTVTTTGSTTSGQFVSVWPTGAWPGTSNLNYTTGQTLAELVMVQTNGDGTFQIRNGANAPVDLIVDVQGYTTIAENPAGNIYMTGTPTRRYDTRPNSGVTGAGTGPVSGTRTVQITGGGGPVPDGAAAVTVNVTVTGATAAGNVTLWASGNQPGTSNLNYAAGQTVANAAIVPLDALGRIQVNVTGGATHVIIDVAGYYRGAVNAWTHTYDANGNRRATTGPPVKWNDSGTRSYQWSTAGGLPVLAVETRPWASGGADTFYWLYGPDHVPVAQVNPDGTLYYLHRDQLGSIAIATNNTGAVVSTRAWDPYGKPTASTGGGWPIPFGWTGDYRDDSGLVNLRARTYDPVTGTFLQRDPITPATREPYRYVSGNPLNATDPSGLCSFGAWIAQAWQFDLVGGNDCQREDAAATASGNLGAATGNGINTSIQSTVEERAPDYDVQTHGTLGASLCSLWCLNVAVQGGEVTWTNGGVGSFGLSGYAGWAALPVERRHPRSLTAGGAWYGGVQGSVGIDENSQVDLCDQEIDLLVGSGYFMGVMLPLGDMERTR